MREASGKIGLSPAIIVRNFHTGNDRAAEPDALLAEEHRAPRGEPHRHRAHRPDDGGRQRQHDQEHARSSTRLPRYGG